MKHETTRMRFPLIASSVLTGIIGCMLFHVGGFMLFPVALDLWYQGTDRTTEADMTPAPAHPAR